MIGWRSRPCRSIGYANVGHHRVPAGRGGALLLHGDEHPHPGRAPGDRDGHGHRPGARADPAGRGRAALASRRRRRRRAATPSSAASTPRTRSPSPRRRARSPATTCPAARRARRHHGLRAYMVPPYYDSLRGEADRHRRQPRDRPQAHAARPRRVRDRGDPDQHRVPQARDGRTPPSSRGSTTRGSSTGSSTARRPARCPRSRAAPAGGSVVGAENWP